MCLHYQCHRLPKGYSLPDISMIRNKSEYHIRYLSIRFHACPLQMSVFSLTFSYGFRWIQHFVFFIVVVPFYYIIGRYLRWIYFKIKTFLVSNQLFIYFDHRYEKCLCFSQMFVFWWVIVYVCPTTSFFSPGIQRTSVECYKLRNRIL